MNQFDSEVTKHMTVLAGFIQTTTQSRSSVGKSPMLQLALGIDKPNRPGKNLSFNMRLFKSIKKDARKGSVDSGASTNTSSSGPKAAAIDSGSTTGGGGRKRLTRGSAPAVLPPVHHTSTLSENLRPDGNVSAGGVNGNAAALKQAGDGRNKLQKRPSNYPSVNLAQIYKRNEQTGEQQIDHTDLLHSLVHHESSEALPQYRHQASGDESLSESGDVLFAKLSSRIWDRIFDELDEADLTCLSLSCKAFRARLQHVERTLAQVGVEKQRTNFLLRIDQSLPKHLLCFKCRVYHLRLQPGKETLRPTNVSNPVFNCPFNSNPQNRISRARIKSNRAIPFTFVQLAMRHEKFGPMHGISVDALSGRYRDKDTVTEWSHQTRFCIVNRHLLMRVTSSTFAPPGLPPAGLRNLLYNPQDEFHPYFSTCPHWRDGELMPLVKCALSHLPVPSTDSGVVGMGQKVRGRFSHASPIISLCSECRPMRRCPECATEYLIEIKMTEDRVEADPSKTFKQALTVTRWSDLGQGGAGAVVPEDDPEWAAVSGLSQSGEFDSITALGRRAISGIFEAQFNVDLIPGQRILNLNPDKEKLGEKGHRWF